MPENFKTFNIALDTKKALYGERVVLVEGDTGNRFVITLTDDGSAVDLTDCRVDVVFSGAMGTAMQNSYAENGKVTIGGTLHNEVTIDVKSGSYSTGLNTCEIRVLSGESYETLVTSASFTFNGKKPIIDESTIAASSELPILVSLIAQVSDLTTREQADWTEADNTKGTYIQNKPVVNVDFAAAAHASRHLIGGADALNAMPYDAASTNLLINGGFAVNQRAKSGTVTLAAGAYGHDRWKAGASGCTYTFATSENVTTLTISAGSLIQVVEGINLKSGTVCLSWTGTAQGKIGAGSYSASGVTGTGTGGTNLNIEFNTGTLSKVQLNYGSAALPFVPKPRNEDHLAYYQLDVARGASGYAVGTVANIIIRLPHGMRATPTPALAYADFVIVGTATIAVTSIASISRTNDATYAVVLNLGSSVASNTACVTANTTINFDAEL